jgi:NADH:ubiquinone oxidoreductase subunit 5 (subunit L)/multisubunit Na+/H+ antiporter MnhA subunit
MSQFLPFFILVPLLGYLVSSFANRRAEGFISWTAMLTAGLNLFGIMALGALWVSGGFQDYHYNGPVIYSSGDTVFAIDLFFDGTTAVYTFVASLITLFDTIFSRYYIHREKGFKRYFNNIQLFYLGIMLILFSGNLEALFVGWEIIGITSFFLISFYRERYLPVKNALKVMSFYRVADVFLLLGIWICHHYFHHSAHFSDWQVAREQGQVIITAMPYTLLIPLIFLGVALVKSAQWPFSSWLPRAMEGPTSSSAIFYGSLSVHIGVFLLLRTYPLWDENWTFKALVIASGVFTSTIATFTARVQSSVKTQIGYSSIAQIGLMFIEVALGWHKLALLHFASNAFLRTYQLLVSPSVLSYLIHDQFFNFIKPQHNFANTLWGKIRMSVYVMSIKEWRMDSGMYQWFWKPLKWFGNRASAIGFKGALFIFAPLYLVGLYFVYHKGAVPLQAIRFLPEIMSIAGLLLVLIAFVERSDARKAWGLIVMNQLFVSLAVAFNEQFDFGQVHLFLSGILVSAVVGYMVLNYLAKQGEAIDLDKFHGHSYEHSKLATVFMLMCLSLAGFPITPTFIGEDLLLSHIHENQIVLTTTTGLGFIVGGLAIFRIYGRIFLGPHEKGYHEVAYRSS